MKLKLLTLSFAALIVLSACESGNQKQTAGTLIGAIGGGLLGSQVGGGSGRLVATGVGTLLGAFLGSEVGKSLDRADRQAMSNTTQETLETNPSGQTSTWQNPDSGNSGTVTPTSTYRNSEGQYCREYQQTVEIGGKSEQAYGTACRQPDGTWQIVNS